MTDQSQPDTPMGRIMGRWIGDETDAEVDAALAGVSDEIKAEPGTWVRWQGGTQPVSDNTKVEVKFESQPVENDTIGIAKHFSWVHQSEDYYMNIVAFRVIPSA